MAETGGRDALSPGFNERRAALKAALAFGVCWSLSDLAMAGDGDPKRRRPQAGDLLVFAAGSRKGEPIASAELPLGGPPAMAYAMDPASRVVRDGTRLNKIVLVRFEPQELSGKAREHAAEGVVAYSAVCTHTGCDVSAWKADEGALLCPCHYTQYDPRSDARVMAGPAPRPLAALPLKVVEGVLVAAGEFVGRIGFKQA